MSTPNGTIIETRSGRAWNYLEPDPANVSIEDIAYALGNTARFGGHTKRFYSVAEHCVLVADILRAEGASAELVYAGLLHDAHEAYLGDVPTPLKRLLGSQYKILADETDDAIARALGSYWTYFHHHLVKDADELALRYEAAELKLSHGAGELWSYDVLLEDPGQRVVGFSPNAAAGIYLEAYQRCYHDCAEAGTLRHHELMPR